MALPTRSTEASTRRFALFLAWSRLGWCLVWRCVPNLESNRGNAASLVVDDRFGDRGLVFSGSGVLDKNARQKQDHVQGGRLMSHRKDKASYPRVCDLRKLAISIERHSTDSVLGRVDDA
jgi:hypothetical protein